MCIWWDGVRRDDDHSHGHSDAGTRPVGLEICFVCSSLALILNMIELMLCQFICRMGCSFCLVCGPQYGAKEGIRNVFDGPAPSTTDP